MYNVDVSTLSQEQTFYSAAHNMPQFTIVGGHITISSVKSDSSKLNRICQCLS